MLTTERTVAWLTARQLLSGKSGLVVILFAAFPALLATTAVLRADADMVELVTVLNSTLIVPVILPIIALIFGVGAFGGEIDDGTIVYLLTKPVARWRVALAKYATAGALTGIAAALSVTATGALAFRGMGPDNIVPGFVLAVVVGAFVYCALFIALGLIVRRAIIIGLLYVVVWEVVVGQIFAGVATLSVAQYVFTIADAVVAGEFATLPASTALPMAALVTVAATLLSIARLRTFELAQEV